ncbi:lytic transglycosylase [Aquicella lusitana]|uniref:Membrane-bound lytic murein transglycosylase D n=1 Tax=Aquicella lusitana TaxID=254246 RepID=A0A370GRN1_9COXI|nr:LysM peptidoglycan-binding domain-containing protein [Aquicella lusitana]RDI46059.1 membrane-bound lytic murein transglycosylase D [Aquicella lusitana]VVC73344.1 Membrane-bound lytic murein transglycosylase D [Aquicella lusitana]
MSKNKLQCSEMPPWIRLLIHFALVSISCLLIEGASFASPSAEGIQIYQKNVHLSPEHKQKLADDIIRYRNADNLWDVLREEFTLPHYEDNPAVQAKIEWFMNNQDFLLRSASRAAPYLYYILQQVRKRHLPAELVLLPIIESGYNPFNRSPVGAVGIWQLMPDTASGYGIKQDGWYDGRRDVIASTRGALNYLAYLQSFFDGTWLYAIAAYNTGEGNVLAAIKRNIREGRDTDFWSLPLSQQTKDYVPSLLALATIISNPEQYPIYLPPVRNAPYLAQVDLGTAIDLKYAASLAGISYKKIIQLNPAFNRTSTSTSSKGPRKLVLPIENVEQFTENLGRSPLNRPINWIHYKIRTGDTLASIAKKFDTSPSAIRKLNRLSKNSLKHGTNLLIPNNGKFIPPEEDFLDEISSSKSLEKEKGSRSGTLALAADERKTSLDRNLSLPANYTLQPGDTIYMIRPKDTLENIAKRFHVSSKNLRVANQLKSDNVKAGKQLIIPTHLANVISSDAATNEQMQKLLPGDTLYMVRHGDTIDKIARKFHTSSSAIRLANLIDDRSLVVGEKIVVPTHLRG